MEVILDSSAWVAFVATDDRFHTKVVQIIAKKPHLLVPFTVIEELLAVFHHRKNKRYALDAVGVLMRSRLTEILYITRDDHEEIWKLYKKNNNSFVDYVDASVVWFSDKYKIPIFTVDSDFKKLGVELINGS